jgi:hypothetical protein
MSRRAKVLQRRLGLNRAKADALMDVLEHNGIGGPAIPGEARDVLGTPVSSTG